ncbi:hypothetical protein SynMITS9220_00772 [Synechococcus sp. MIT S9220]|nr:hypothetical protein SynMITS9220_00772 [Synechococcus sp. MIT S9220]
MISIQRKILQLSDQCHTLRSDLAHQKTPATAGVGLQRNSSLRKSVIKISRGGRRPEEQ